MSKDRKKFWMVYGEGRSIPVHKHTHAEHATREAGRLAEKYPGTRFYVLEAISASEIVRVVTTTLDDIHF